MHDPESGRIGHRTEGDSRDGTQWPGLSQHSPVPANFHHL